MRLIFLIVGLYHHMVLMRNEFRYRVAPAPRCGTWPPKTTVIGNKPLDGQKLAHLFSHDRCSIRGVNGTSFCASDNARYGNNPEDCGAYFRDRNVGRGSACLWLASRIVDFDWRVEIVPDLKSARARRS